MGSITTKGIQWAYGVQGTKGTAVVTTAGFKIRKDSHPDMKPGMTPVDLSTQDGRWGQSDYSEATGISRPTLDGLPLYLNGPLLSKFLDQLMTSSGTTTITYALLTGTAINPVATKYMTMLRHNGLATAKDKRMTDGVLKGFKISSSLEQNAAHLDVDLVGSALSVAYTPTTDAYTLPSDSILCHKGIIFKIGATAFGLAEWDLSVDFGTYGIVDNASAPTEFLLGDLKVTGNVRCPWIDDDAVNDYMQSVGNVLTFLWGTAGSSGYLEIKVPVKYDEPTEDKDLVNRLRQGIGFHYAEQAGQALSILYSA
jgi:hypothetical protein